MSIESEDLNKLYKPTFTEMKVESRKATLTANYDYLPKNDGFIPFDKIYGIGHDAFPSGSYWNNPPFEPYRSDNVGLFNSLYSLENIRSKEELWAVATNSPQGHFMTFVASIDAFRNEWRYVERKNGEEVDENLKELLLKLRKNYNIKHIHTIAAGTARALGKSLVCKVKQKSFGYKKLPKIKLRVFPIFDWEIDYDTESGDPIEYHPMGPVGLLWHRFDVPADEAVLYVHKPDPFGNTYQGIPETFPVYNQLMWLANIQRGWAEAMDSRGISMMQFKIPGYDPDEADMWRSAYGDPTKYRVAFTDDDIEIVNIPGVNAAFDPMKTMEMFSSESAAATGIARSRYQGTQIGQVTGSQTDTDNYYSILNTIQEEFEPQLIALHEFLDHKVIDTFDISWDIEPKLDKYSKAQIDATNIATIMSGSDLYTYNQALEKMGLEKLGPEGDVPYSVYVFRMHIDEGIELAPEDEMNMEANIKSAGKPSNNEQPTSTSSKPQVTSESMRRKQPPTPDKDTNHENRGGDRSGESVQCKQKLASGRRCGKWTTDPSGYCDLHRGGKKGGKWGSKKDQMERARKIRLKAAAKMRRSGDSYTIINNELKQIYQEGFSNNILKDIDSAVSDLDRYLESNGECFLTDSEKDEVIYNIFALTKEEPVIGRKKIVEKAIEELYNNDEI